MVNTDISIYMKGEYEEFHALRSVKKQSQSNPLSNGTRAFCSQRKRLPRPSGLAMTFVSLLICAPSTEFILSTAEWVRNDMPNGMFYENAI